MPTYEIVKSPGLQFPVGHRFDSDDLHVIMRQHVIQVKDGKQAAAVGGPELNTLDDQDEANAELAAAWDEAAAMHAVILEGEREAKKVAEAVAAKKVPAKSAKDGPSDENT
jgi:hypothetical protein